MRKTVFKITGVVALATLMVLNIQFSKLDKDSKISLSYLKNMAFAQGGEDDGGSAFNYDEYNTGGNCKITWDFGIYKDEQDGNIWACKSGTEWFCNSGCYTIGDSPS